MRQKAKVNTIDGPWKKISVGVFLYSQRGSAAASSAILDHGFNISHPETIIKYN